MLITSLCDYARRNGLTEDPAFEAKSVAWVLEIEDDGRPLRIAQNGTVQMPASGKGKPKFIPAELKVPKVGNRNDGKTPCFAADTLGRVVPGWAEFEASAAGKEPKPAEINTRANFIDLIREAAQATDNASLHAISKFYELAAADPSILEPLHQTLVAEKAKPANWITFRRWGDRDVTVLELEPVREFWRQRHQSQQTEKSNSAEQMRCLSCGRTGPIAQTHDKLRGVPGGNPSGVSLVSSDKAAFGSFGLKKSLTSPTCPDCVDAYCRALNDLLAAPSHRYIEGDVAFCFWTREPVEDDLMAMFTQPDAGQVKRLFETPHRPASGNRNLDSNDFFAVSLSGVGGRAMVREWIEETVPRVRDSLRLWFEQLAIVVDRPLGPKDSRLALPGDIYECWPLRDLVQSLGRRSEGRLKVTPQLPTLLFKSAIRGSPLPDLVLAAAVRRIQADHDVPPARAALLRLALNRNVSRLQTGATPMSAALDPDRKDPAYLCGRLFAVLARLQYLAQGSTNATIVDRNYGAASSSPVTVFGRLMDLAQSYLKKLSASMKGAAVNIEKDIEEILSKLTDWPRQLPLEQQALFALGFYHQRAEYRSRRKDQGGSEGEEPLGDRSEDTDAE